jgi:transcription initiation factor TFIIIB Brf1 subunit/transcription initiation factor TFIIB
MSATALSVSFLCKSCGNKAWNGFETDERREEVICKTCGVVATRSYSCHMIEEEKTDSAPVDASGPIYGTATLDK